MGGAVVELSACYATVTDFERLFEASDGNGTVDRVPPLRVAMQPPCSVSSNCHVGARLSV
jgi:hypothetical protein